MTSRNKTPLDADPFFQKYTAGKAVRIDRVRKRDLQYHTLDSHVGFLTRRMTMEDGVGCVFSAAAQAAGEQPDAHQEEVVRLQKAAAQAQPDLDTGAIRQVRESGLNWLIVEAEGGTFRVTLINPMVKRSPLMQFLGKLLGRPVG